MPKNIQRKRHDIEERMMTHEYLSLTHNKAPNGFYILVAYSAITTALALAAPPGMELSSSVGRVIVFGMLAAIVYCIFWIGWVEGETIQSGIKKGVWAMAGFLVWGVIAIFAVGIGAWILDQLGFLPT